VFPSAPRMRLRLPKRFAGLFRLLFPSLYHHREVRQIYRRTHRRTIMGKPSCKPVCGYVCPFCITHGPVGRHRPPPLGVKFAMIREGSDAMDAPRKLGANSMCPFQPHSANYVASVLAVGSTLFDRQSQSPP